MAQVVGQCRFPSVTKPVVESGGRICVARYYVLPSVGVSEARSDPGGKEARGNLDLPRHTGTRSHTAIIKLVDFCFRGGRITNWNPVDIHPSRGLPCASVSSKSFGRPLGSGF